MLFRTRADGRRGRILPLVAGLCSAAVVFGAQHLFSPSAEPSGTADPQRVALAAARADGTDFTIVDATWTTADIHQKGLHLTPYDTGLVVTYMAPSGRNPSAHKDWVGIYEKGRIDRAHRVDWDWVCPNEPNRCTDYGSAVIPAGDDGLRSGATYTIAYWPNDASEAGGPPAATIDFVVPW
ncbi:hypothetical protein [Streptomyces sp. NPDC001985]|uniref:hypothetical protein n=1 Tax=Streptomyces sp. NPDC001985 TaxID=3154406 RepID=UPI00332F31FE